MSGSDHFADGRSRYFAAKARAARSRDFWRESLNIVDDHRPASSLAWGWCGKARRERIANIALSEWKLLCPKLSELPADLSPGDFRQALTANVRRRIQQEKVGFVWWLPILYAVAEVIIRLLIERWLAR